MTVSLVLTLALLAADAAAQDAAVDTLRVPPIQAPSAAAGPTPASSAAAAAPPTPARTEENSDVAPAVDTNPARVAATAPSSNQTEKHLALLTAVTIFVLACFVGYEVIGKVPAMLHTPLMSGSNAISGITVVGAIIIGGFSLGAFSSFVGFVAIGLAMINIVGGFLVTLRMLSMFKRR